MKQRIKKSIYPFVALALFCLTMFGCPVSAATQSTAMADNTVTWTETTPDGYTVIYTITQDIIPVGSQSRATKTVSGSGTATVKKNSDTLYTLSVHATFSVNVGVSATCTGCSYTYSIKNSSWHFDSATATKSGNTATATGTFHKEVLFITTDTRTTTVKLICDKNGNLTQQ